MVRRAGPSALANGSDGVVVGLVECPDGMPGLFASGVSNLVLEDVIITRPSELPVGWNPEIIVQA